MKNILIDVSDHVTSLLTEKLNKNFIYHNLLHTKEVVNSAREIGIHSGLSDNEIDLLTIAAWFHDTGFISGTQYHEMESIRIATNFLKTTDLSIEDIDIITNLIVVTELHIEPETILQKVMKDADILNIGKDSFFITNQKIKGEREFFENKEIDKIEWLYSSLQFIMNTDFYTDYARNRYGQQRRENIRLLNDKINHLEINKRSV